MIRVEATLARSVLLTGFTLASGEEVRLRLDIWHLGEEDMFRSEVFNFSVLRSDVKSEGRVVVCDTEHWILDIFCSGLLAGLRCRTVNEAIESSLALLNQHLYPEP